jgi:hypothetical protein
MKYLTNFYKDEIKGNAINEGSTLKIRVVGAEIVTARIKNSIGNLMDIAQSHKFDSDNDEETIEIKLFRKRFLAKKNFPTGEYDLVIWFWDNDTQKGGHYKERFEIV